MQQRNRNLRACGPKPSRRVAATGAAVQRGSVPSAARCTTGVRANIQRLSVCDASSGLSLRSVKQQARNEAFQAIAKSEFLFIGRYWPHVTHVSTCEPLSMLAGFCSAQSTRMPSSWDPAQQLCSVRFCRAATTAIGRFRFDPLRTRVQLRVHHRRAHRAAVVRRRVHRRSRYRPRAGGRSHRGRKDTGRQYHGGAACGVLDGTRWVSG